MDTLIVLFSADDIGDLFLRVFIEQLLPVLSVLVGVLHFSQFLHFLQIQIILLILLELAFLRSFALRLSHQALTSATISLFVNADGVGPVHDSLLLLLELLLAQITREVALKAAILLVYLLMQAGLALVDLLTLIGLGRELCDGSVEARRLDLALLFEDVVNILPSFLLLLLFLAGLLLMVVD